MEIIGKLMYNLRSEPSTAECPLTSHPPKPTFKQCKAWWDDWMETYTSVTQEARLLDQMVFSRHWIYFIRDLTRRKCIVYKATFHVWSSKITDGREGKC